MSICVDNQCLHHIPPFCGLVILVSTERTLMPRAIMTYSRGWHSLAVCRSLGRQGVEVCCGEEAAFAPHIVVPLTSYENMQLMCPLRKCLPTGALKVVGALPPPFFWRRQCTKNERAAGRGLSRRPPRLTPAGTNTETKRRPRTSPLNGQPPNPSIANRKHRVSRRNLEGDGCAGGCDCRS